jgi:ferritin
LASAVPPFSLVPLFRCSDVPIRRFAGLRQRLRKTLDEERATDKKLTTLAESKMNLRAAN